MNRFKKQPVHRFNKRRLGLKIQPLKPSEKPTNMATNLSWDFQSSQTHQGCAIDQRMQSHRIAFGQRYREVMNLRIPDAVDQDRSAECFDADRDVSIVF